MSGLAPLTFGEHDPSVAQQDLVTGQMCATVHLDATFANRVARQLLSVPHAAVWPLCRVDYVTLARHAKFSRERRVLRDISLCLLMLLMLLSWVLLVGAMVTQRLRISFTVLGLVVISLVIYAAAYLVVWLFYEETVAIVDELTYRPLEAEERLEAWPGLPKAPPGFAGAVTAAMFRFNAVLMRVRGEVRAGWRELIGRDGQRELPTQDVWAYLAGLNDANVALYNRNAMPLELAGEPLDSWTMTLNLTKHGDSGKFLPPPTARVLHKKLLKDVPDGSLPQLTARSLYVVNGAQPDERGLFRNWRKGEPETEAEARVGARGTRSPGEKPNPDGWYLEHPDMRVTEAQIDELLVNPPEGGRVYAYFQKYSWRGHLVIGAAVRVYRAENTLFIEFDAHALPPLADGFNNMYELPTTPRTKRKALARTVAARTPSLLFQSMRGMYMLFFTPSGRMGVVRELQQKHEDDGRIDYGSPLNLRLIAGDPEKLTGLAYADELDNARVLRDRVLKVIGEFLGSYGIPELDAEFAEQVRVMRERTHNFGTGGGPPSTALTNRS